MMRAKNDLGSKECREIRERKSKGEWSQLLNINTISAFIENKPPKHSFHSTYKMHEERRVGKNS